MMKSNLIKTIYLYVVSVIGVVMTVVGLSGLINTTVKLAVFDEYPIPYYSDLPVKETPAGTTERTAKEKAEDERLADERKQQARQVAMVNDLTQAIALTIVGGAVYIYHWRLARKEA